MELLIPKVVEKDRLITYRVLSVHGILCRTPGYTAEVRMVTALGTFWVRLSALQGVQIVVCSVQVLTL